MIVKLWCFLEVDIKYSEQLGPSHKELVAPPEKMKINEDKKLVCNLNDKKLYAVHFKKLKEPFKLWFKKKLKT